MGEYVIPLDRACQAGATQVGGKAAMLGALLEAGFPVPLGLCLTAAAFRLALDPWLDRINTILRQHGLHDPDGALAASRLVDALLHRVEVPAPVIEALHQALPAIAGPETPLAVRSSATAEDTAAASFAGQYRSLLGVSGLDALLAAVVAVWRSFYSPHALVARAAHGSLGSEEAMALLILPVIEAECAGVALSVDPVQRRNDRAVITAVWGLGPGVVNGSLAADTAWVRRQGSTEGFEVEEQRVVDKAAQFVLHLQGGLQQVPVPSDRRRAACLPPSWLERVAQFCVAAEVLFGRPQDMEWAIAAEQVWVLQSRPITALPPEIARLPSFPVSWESQEERCMAWVHYPYWRHVLKPLEIDYAHDREAGSRESSLSTGGERFEQIKIANGRIYTCWAPTGQSAGDRRVRRAALDDLAARLHRQGTTAWEHWGPEIVKATERLAAFEPGCATGPELALHLEDARGAFRRHWAIHGSRLGIPRQPLYAAYAAVTGQPLLAVEEAVDRLLEGEETPHTRLIDGLYGLACTARALPALAALVADPPPDALDHLATLSGAATFRAQFHSFLCTFGDRSGVGYGSDGTICTPAWRENPALVLRLVASYLDPQVEPPAAARARAQAQREALIDQVCASCDDAEAVALLRRELAYGRRQAAVMEEHNHYIDQMMNGQLRRAILAAGHSLVARGDLSEVDEVFWLHYDEILAALREDASPSLAGTIAVRQAQHARWKALEPPPLLGTPPAHLPARPPLRDEVTPLAQQVQDRVVGLGASPGRHRGRSRVFSTSVLLPDLAPGEVLVAENLGPRWTPLLPILGGLVLDGGAVGQHHAITAREYGVPAVIGTGNATRRIPDGAWVTVDGTTGVVEIETTPAQSGTTSA